MISLEDLIIAKIIWIQDYQNEQQMNDIRNLLLNPDKNMNYIKKWCDNLILNTFDLFRDD